MRRLDNRRSHTVEKLQNRAGLHSGASLLQPKRNTAKALGYGRISKDDQIIDMQISALRQAGVADEDMFLEQISAVNAHRPQWNLLQKMVEPGDTIFFYAFNRICRNVKDLLTFIDDMKAMGVTLRSTTEPHIDPFTTNGRMVVSITGAVDENERLRICDRTRDGMAEKKRQGMFFGRTRIVTPAVARKMQTMRDAGTKVISIAGKFGIKPSTVYANTKKQRGDGDQI